MEDRSRSERGTIDANVVEAKTYYGQPALYVRERLTGKIVPCVLTENAANVAGPTHSWQDTWGGRRLRVKGEIFYDRRGAINRVSATSVTDVDPIAVELSEMRRMNLTDGNTPSKHIDALWGYSSDQ